MNEIQELYIQQRGSMEKDYKDPELQLKRLEVSRTKILVPKQHLMHTALQGMERMEHKEFVLLDFQNFTGKWNHSRQQTFGGFHSEEFGWHICHVISVTEVWVTEDAWIDSEFASHLRIHGTAVWSAKLVKRQWKQLSIAGWSHTSYQLSVKETNSQTYMWNQWRAPWTPHII